MSIIWKPNGQLDVCTDPTDLPQETDGKNITSGAMTRCKNLHLYESGVAKTRWGSYRLAQSALTGIVTKMIQMGSTRYEMTYSNIYTDGTSRASGYSNAVWSALIYHLLSSTTQTVYATNGTDQVKMEGNSVYNWGIAAPTVAPTISGGTGSGLTGAYSIKYTYVRKSGATVLCESNPSDASNTETISNDSLALYWEAPTDAQVTHVRIYRTAADGSTYYFLKDETVGSGTSDDDSTADSSLGSAVSEDHDTPPATSTYVFGPSLNGTLFAIDAHLLYYCSPKEPEYWPLTYYIEVSTPTDPLLAGCFFDGMPYVFSKRRIYQIRGSGHGTFFPLEMNAFTGIYGRKCFAPVPGKGIFHMGSDGVYLFNTTGDVKATQQRFDPIFMGETRHGMPGVDYEYSNHILIVWHDRLYVFYKSTEDANAPASCIVFNVTSGKTSYYKYPFEIREACVDDYNDRLLIADTDGYIWKIEDPDYPTDYISVSSNTAISWEAESKEFTLQTRAHFPRWAKYDVDAHLATTASGYMLLDGTIHQTHTLSGDRQTRKRLIDTGNGKRASVRIGGSGPVEIFATEFE